jgi:hypothetical protein
MNPFWLSPTLIWLELAIDNRSHASCHRRVRAEEKSKENKRMCALGYDGNKSFYLLFVGVIFLSILDCF